MSLSSLDRSETPESAFSWAFAQFYFGSVCDDFDENRLLFAERFVSDANIARSLLNRINELGSLTASAASEWILVASLTDSMLVEAIRDLPRRIGFPVAAIDIDRARTALRAGDATEDVKGSGQRAGGSDSIAELTIELAMALPKFEASSPKGSRQRLSHFADTQAEALVQRVKRIEGQSARGGRSGNPQWARDEASYRLAIGRELDYVELFGADLTPESRRQGLSVAYVSLTLRDTTSRTADATAPVSVDEMLNSLDSSQGRLLIRGAAGAGKSTLFRWIAITAASGKEPSAWWRFENVAHAYLEAKLATPLVVLTDEESGLARWTTDQSLPSALSKYFNEARRSLTKRSGAQSRIGWPLLKFSDDTPSDALEKYLVGGSDRWGIQILADQDYDTAFSYKPVVQTKWQGGWRARTPFLLRLRDFATGPMPGPEELPNALSLGFGRPPARWIESILSAGGALLLFDGVDELPPSHRDEVSGKLEILLSHYPGNYVLLSTRPEAVPEAWLSNLGFKEAWIEPLSERDKRQFIDNWHKAVAEQAEAVGKPTADLLTLADELKSKLPTEAGIARLAEVPLLCAMICALHRDRRQKLPESQVELCDALCHMLLHRRERESGLDLSAFPESYRTLTYEQKRAIVKELAHYMVDNDQSSVEKPIATAVVARMLERFVGHDPASAAIVCESLVERSGMLREVLPGRLDFIHNTFKEYLAAERFAEDGSVGRLVKQAVDASWQPIVVFAAASRQPAFTSRLLSELLRQTRGRTSNKRDTKISKLEARSRQLLALRCRQVAVQLSPELIKELDEIVFELFPPRTMADAEVLASSGDLAVQHLRYDSRRPPHISAACAHTLRLIGTDHALTVLRDYRSDRRAAVVAELLNVTKPFELEAVRITLASGERLAGSVASYIESLDGIDELTIGPTLDLSGTRIETVAPLLKCQQIETLVLTGINPFGTHEPGRVTKIRMLDISGLASLRRLRSLSLSSSTIQNLGPLAEIKSLTDLDLDNTGCTSVASVAELGLESLRLTRLSGPLDLSEIGKLQSLRRLDLSGSVVRSLEPLKGLAMLEELRLVGVPVEDFSPIGSLRRLKRLHLDGTRPRDIRFLESLQELEELHVQSTHVDFDDVARLESVARGRRLSLVGIPITGTRDMTPTQRTPIDVALIVALGEEFEEVEKLVAGWRAIPSAVEGDYDYRFNRERLDGAAPDQCVAVVVGEMGTEATAIRVTSLLNTYAPRTLAIVGIAGALRDDVHVGDVIIGEFVDLYLANSKAVRGRRRDRLEFERAPDPYRPSEQWVRAAKNIRYAHKPAFEKWKSTAQAELKNQVPHARIRQTLMQKGLLRRTPSYLVAPVASGPAVVASEAFRKWILTGNRRYGAVEMESGGFLKAVQQTGRGANAIVLRGISDLADSRKKELDRIGKGGLRRYAMQNAIRFLWLLLDHPPGATTVSMSELPSKGTN